GPARRSWRAGVAPHHAREPRNWCASTETPARERYVPSRQEIRTRPDVRQPDRSLASGRTGKSRWRSAPTRAPTVVKEAAMNVVPVRVGPMVIAVLCGALAIAGCGGGDAPAGPDAAGDPSEVVAPDGPTPAAADPGTVESCDLLTQEEAAAAAGNPVREGQDHGGGCIWEQEDYTDRPQLQVSPLSTPTPPAPAAEQLCESAVSVLRDPEPMDGFGDQSYWK